MTDKQLIIRALITTLIAIPTVLGLTWVAPATDPVLAYLLVFGFGFAFMLASKRLKKGAGRK